MPLRPKPRSIGALLTVFLVSVSLWTMGPAPAAAQSDPAMTVGTSATYRVLVDEGRVEVEFHYAFENQTVATAFPGFFESLPVDAVDVIARDNSGDLPAVPTDDADGFDTWLVGFRAPLEPGETTEISIAWSIEGTQLPGPIVEAGAVAFDLYVPGPEGAAWNPPSVELPSGFVAVDSATPTAPYEIIRAEFLNVAAFSSSVTNLPPEITISDWQAAGSWSADVRDRAEAVVASLESWFGPRVDPLEIRRALPSEDHATIAAAHVELRGDDAESVDHQLAHAWLSDVPVDEDWFVEGLAAAFAGDRPTPSGPADVMPLIVNEIGAAGVRAIVDALRDGTVTYPGVVAEPQPLPPDWRTLLDHLEGPSGTEGVVELFRSEVVGDESLALLDRRSAARTDYAALEFRAGGWTLPPYLRLAMASWEFDEFSAAQGEVSDVIVRRDSLLAWAESLELEPRDDAKEIFESAEIDMAEVEELLDEQEAALAAFDEAERLVNGDRGLLAAIGLLGHDAEGDLLNLRDAWAEGRYETVEHDGHELASLVEGAVGDGTIRLLVPALGLLALWQAVRVVRRRLSLSTQQQPVPDQP